MSSYPSDENISHDEFDNNHQTIFVSSDIENVVLVSYKVSRWE